VLKAVEDARNAPLPEEDVKARMKVLEERRKNPPDKTTLARWKDEGVLIFARGSPSEQLLCVFNFTSRPVTREIDVGKPSVLWANDAVLAGGSLIMEPFGSAILKLA
jgi:hypothetical protein